MDLLIRFAKPEDAEELLKIYAPYVTDTVITFEYEVPSPEEFRNRIHSIMKKYPYLVAEKDGEILGYAYAGVFKDRAAYDWSVETTIYIRRDRKRSGIGKQLYHALEEVLRAQNIYNLYACIGYPEVEDEYLTKNSAQFHAHLGYRMVGEFYHCGYKFNRWYNMVWMEKLLDPDVRDVQPVKWMESNREELEQVLAKLEENQSCIHSEG